MSVVGVDFGQQNSVIAAAGRGGVDVMLNGSSNRLNPSMVAFDQARKMGEQAATTAIGQYKNTITSMKRLVGLAFDDPRAAKERKRLPFECVPVKHANNGPSTVGVKVTYNGEQTVVPVEAVAGMLVKHMGMIVAQKAAAESMGSTDPKSVAQMFPQDWVVAIPSYYTDAQRRALLVGCEIVGITGVQRLMHENTATALAYGIFKDIKKEFEPDKPTYVMFIDIGASAYTASIAAFEPGKLSVKSSYCDPDLGGRDFDQVIAEWIAAKFVEKYGKKLSGDPMSEPKVVLKLLAAAEKAKKTLSPHGVKEASINLECLMDDLDFNIKLDANEYEKLCEPLLVRLAEPVTKALAEAKLKASDLSSIEIVGGSTRINCVKQRIKKVLGVSTLSTTMNADESVARGAALQSAILSPRFKVLPYDIIEAQPLPISIAWDEEVASSTQQGVEVDGEADGSEMPTNSVVMFDRGLTFPITRRVTLRRNGPFAVKASYDESAASYGLVEGATREIANFIIQAPKGEDKKVRVNVKQDIHGIINLSSAQMVEEIEEEGAAAPPAEGEVKEGNESDKPPTEEKKKKIKRTNLEHAVARSLDWTRDEIAKAQQVEVAMETNDRLVRETADMQNELESYIYDMRDKLDLDLAPFATDDEKDAFNAKREEIENWLYDQGFDATKDTYADKLAQLKALGIPIERRQTEAEGRAKAVAALQANVEKHKNWLTEAQGNEKYAHITEEEFSRCHAKCDEVSAWVYEMLDKQGSLAQNENPVVSINDINAKSAELTQTCSPIIHKPAPKKVEPEPTPMETDDKAATAGGDDNDKMDVDGEEGDGGETKQ